MPVIQLAVEPKTKADQEKLGMAIQKLAQEDPTFRVNTDPETGRRFFREWANCTWKSSWTA